MSEIETDKCGAPTKDWWCVPDYGEDITGAFVIVRKGYAHSVKGTDYIYNVPMGDGENVETQAYAEQIWEAYNDIQVDEFKFSNLLAAIKR